MCYSNGTWGESVYSECIDVLRTHQRCIAGYCQTCPDLLRETVINVSLALSVISVGVLVSALVLFSIFDSIQCRRLSIHKHLAVAFVFRFTFLALWTIANTTNFFRDCTHFNSVPLRNWEIPCKILLWRTVKATILLVPLLGVSNIPLFYEPEEPGAIYMLGSAILQHSQGIFIAVLYCFLNGEIQNAVRRQLSKVPFSWLSFLHRPRFETERTYVPEQGVVNRRLGMPMEELNHSSSMIVSTTPPQTTRNGGGIEASADIRSIDADDIKQTNGIIPENIRH
uniref:G-protein coupled receptors family 2 profile 2 domain-containing protein n=1 Tax=Panagrolaimus sp. ES5 TaxID=591445 RepID=A0AC34GPZ9_9BILA